MNPVALFFASGDSLYLGAALLLLAIVASPYLQTTPLRALRALAAWLGFAMIVMASPPFSWAVDAIFAATFFLWLLALNGDQSGRFWARLRRASAAILLVLLVVFRVSELFHRGMPMIKGTPSDHLVVVGDSISAGIGTRVPAWPMLLQQQSGILVKNLSRPGADTSETQAMAAQVALQDTAVLIEIGGNDLLSGVPSADFGHALDSLLSALARPGRMIVMFELPLLPHKVAYGRIQRRLASRYGVFLIPKHYFTNVISGANAISDGLHLSNIGAPRMADVVAQALSPVLKRATSSAETSVP